MYKSVRYLSYALCFVVLCSTRALADGQKNPVPKPEDQIAPLQIAFGPSNQQGLNSVFSTDQSTAKTAAAPQQKGDLDLSVLQGVPPTNQSAPQTLAIGQPASQPTEADPDLQVAQVESQAPVPTNKKKLALEPILLNYVSTSYNAQQLIEWSKFGGTHYSKIEQDSWRNPGLLMFAGGKLGSHIGFFTEFAPDAGTSGSVQGAQKRGFFDKFGELQGTVNIGNAERYLQLRGGQIYTTEGAGFGGADRLYPEMDGPINSFGGYSGGPYKGLALSATLPHLMTGEVYGYFGGSAGGNVQSDDYNVAFGRPEGGGVDIQKVIGSTGLSGFSAYLNLEHTPVYTISPANGIALNAFNPGLFPTVPAAPTRQTDTIEGFFYLNKTILDRDNWERTNLLCGAIVGGSSYFLDLPPAAPGKSNYSYANGCFAEIDYIPIKGYLSLIAQYSMYAPTNLIPNQAQQTFATGAAIDIHGPFKSRGRVTVEYATRGYEHSSPAHAIILSYWPIF